MNDILKHRTLPVGRAKSEIKYTFCVQLVGKVVRSISRPSRQSRKNERGHGKKPEKIVADT
jgi:hypothetical protein